MRPQTDTTQTVTTLTATRTTPGRVRWRIAALAGLMVAGVSIAATGVRADADPAVRFPVIETRDLNERPATLPADLPGARTLVLVAFQHRQQDDVDTWVGGMGLDRPDAPEWIELPVVPNWGMIFRMFLDNAMRSGIPAEEVRARVFTVYGDRDGFLAALGLPTDEQIYALVVDRNGHVLARADGVWSPESEARIRDALATVD